MLLEQIDIVAAGNILGENVLWDDRSQIIWWTDIQASALFQYDWRSRRLQSFRMPERLAAFGLVEDSSQLIAAFESGFGFLNPQSGKIEWINRPLAGKTGMRFNDGRIDAQGRFWCGTMMEDSSSGINAVGSLFCLSPDGCLSQHVQNIKIPNAICWSPDSTRMYLADSLQRNIDVFDFAASAGALSNRRSFVETEDNIYPDGAVTDAEGFLWNAQWNGHRVVRYTPDGKVDLTLPLPVSQPTCVTFGGPDLDHLFITSAREGLSASALEAQPLAGSLFIYKTGAKGRISSRYGYRRPKAIS